MKTLLSVLLLLVLTSSVYAGGPALPDEYRLPSEDELSSGWRTGNPDKYASIAADFNGDGLVDGCYLAVDKKQNRLVVLVALLSKGGNSEKWLKLQTLNYEVLRYQGIDLVKPATVSVYVGRDKEKRPPSLNPGAV